MSITQPGIRTEGDSALEQRVLGQLEHDVRSEGHRRTLGGVGLTGLAVAVAGGVTWAMTALADKRITLALPYYDAAQEAVNSIDKVLVPVGAFAVPAAIAAIGATKLAGKFSNRARFADEFSSREPSSDGRPRGAMARLTRRIGIAAAGAALATFTSGIATEVTDGPNRSIEAFRDMLPGDTLVVQYKEAMPMVASSVNAQLESNIRTEAAQRGVATHSFSFNLGAYSANGKARTDLFAGIEVQAGSSLDWIPGSGCTDIPLIIDGASGKHVGDQLAINGISSTVVGTTEGGSSMGRIAGVVDKEAMKACLQQDPEAPSYGIAVDADPKTAADIIADARHGNTAPAAAISDEQYIENSKEFWESNVKPITNVMALISGAVALMAMTGAMGARLLRNRRELAAMLADGTKAGTIRFAELIRSAKDGLLATVVGVTAAIPITISANTLESGFRAGVGLREALIGAALGLAGTIGGAALSLIGLRRTADPETNTRA